MAVRITVYGTANMKQIAEARKELDKLEKQAKANSNGFASAMNKIGSSASSVGSKMTDAGKSMTKGLTVPLVALGAGLYKATQAAADDAAAQVRLATTLKNTAGATDAQIASIESWITAQGKALGIADDNLRPALITLTTATKDVGKAQKLAAVAMDLATAKGIPLEKASQAIAKAYAGNAKSLQMLLPGIDAGAVKSKNFGAIMQSVAGIVGGQAAAAAETEAGKRQRANVALNEAIESLGTSFLPIMQQVTTIIQNNVVPAIEQLTTWWSHLDRGTQDNIVKVGLLLAVLGPLTSVLGRTISAIGSTASAIGWMSKQTVAAYGGIRNLIVGMTSANAANSAFATPMVRVGGAIRSAALATKGFIVDLARQGAAMVASAAKTVASTAATVASRAAQLAAAAATGVMTAAQWALNAAMTANPIGIVIVAIGALVAALVLLWNKNEGFRNALIAAWNAIKNGASTVWNFVVEKIKGAIAFIAGLPSRMLQLGKQIIEGLWNGLSGAKDWLIDKVKGIGSSILDGVKSVFGISSPSKKFAEIGVFLNQGLAKGIKTSKQLPIEAAVATGKDVVTRSYEAMAAAYKKNKNAFKTVDPWAEFMTDPAGTKTKDQKTVSKAVQRARAIAQAIKEQTKNLMGSWSFGEMVKAPDVAVTAQSLLEGMKSQAVAMQNFVANISKLRKTGLAAGVIASLLAAGPAQAGAQASAFASMSAAQIKDYNAAYAQEAKFAGMAAKMGQDKNYAPNVTIAPGAVQVTIQGNADPTATEAALNKALAKLVTELRSK